MLVYIIIETKEVNYNGLVCPPGLTNSTQLYSGNVFMVTYLAFLKIHKFQLSPTRVEYDVLLPFLENTYNLTDFTSNTTTGSDNSLVVCINVSLIPLYLAHHWFSQDTLLFAVDALYLSVRTLGLMLAHDGPTQLTNGTLFRL